MSKHPSPRLDQLRAMREAKFARSLQSQRTEEKPAAPAKRAPAVVQEVVPAPAPDELAPAVSAKKPAAKKPKAAAKPPAKKKAEKAEKAAKKTAKEKAG
jgi:hypothetical protein